MKIDAIARRVPDPQLDDQEFAMQPIAVRDRVRTVCDAMRTSLAANSTVTGAVTAFGEALGLPYKTARRRWDKVLQHGWRGASDGRVSTIRKGALDKRPAFLAQWRSLCDKHNRSIRAAYFDLVTLWRAGERIDGYEEWGGHPPPDPLTDVPECWSIRTLTRYAPTSDQRILARLGRKAFAGATTALCTTRVGLRCGEVYQFDDVWHDHDVFVGKQLVRPLELGCIDVFSTRRVLYGLAPRLRNDDDTKQGLKERYMLWLTLALLTGTGYWPEGCTLIVEHGTAALSEAIERALHSASGGKIRIERSGIQDKATILGWWAGEGGGNPRAKALLESLHRYYHNRLGALPGQTGSNSRTDKPEQLAAVEKYSARLAREMDSFTPDQVASLMGLLRLPALTMTQFHVLLDQLYTLIDSRTQHAMEGWDRSGLVRAQWRLSAAHQDWHDAGELATLSEEQYAVARGMLDGNPALTRSVRLSPIQVWTEGLPKLRRLPPWTIHQIIPEHMAREVTVSGRAIEFDDREIDPDGLRFESVATDIHGRRVLLPVGEKFLAYVNPLQPAGMVLVDARGVYVGTSLRIERAPRVTSEALHRAIGAEARRQNERMLDYQTRNAGEADAHQSMLTHNDLVLSVARALQAGQTTEQTASGEDEEVEEVGAGAQDNAWLVRRGMAANREG
jgi:hypothetical protein